MIVSNRRRLVVTTRSVALIVLCAMLTPTRPLAQAPSIHYVYDELNRLVAVVDQRGNAATYTYDAVGNILRVDRFDATADTGGVAISLFTPSAGAAGSTVQVFGRGFGASIAQNSLSFDGHPAQVVAAAPNRLVATVPSDATTGPLSVAAPAGSARSNAVFRVLRPFGITPEMASLRVSGRLAFMASDTFVRWAVNGLPGGDPTIGTISADGIYTAPTAIPVPSTVTITATHRDDATLTASAFVTILPAFELFLASRPVSVMSAAAPLVMDRSVGASVSVLASPPTARLATGPAVSIQLEPVVLALVPSGTAPGETLPLTITGRGFGTAMSVLFLKSNVVDPAFSIEDLLISADGTTATARVRVAPHASSGPRVVQIVTPDAVSTSAGTGGNVFSIQ